MPASPATPPRPPEPVTGTGRSATATPARRNGTRSISVGRPDPAPATLEHVAQGAAADEGGGRVVQAAGRFRELVAGRPWRRRRRAILAATAVIVLVLVAGLAAAVFLPTLQVQQITITGLGYVEEKPVREVVEGHTGDSVLLLPTSAIADDIAAVPGVRSAEVERAWPDGVRVKITETAPVALLTRADGATAVVDAEGQELPAAAGESASLIPVTVDGGSADPEGAAAAMSEVLAGMPDTLRGSIQEVTASSASDVTLVIALEDGGTKTIVWGDSADAELKVEVVQALIAQPGSVIDVSSPVAPVTR